MLVPRLGGMTFEMQYLRLVLMVIVAALWGAASGAASARDVAVAVTSKPIHSLVAAVMGETGQATLIVDGAASPHVFALTPSRVKALYAADVVFRVSVELEPFSQKIAQALPPAVKLVSLAEAPGVKRLTRRLSPTFEAHHDAHGDDDDVHQDAEGGHEADPHVWLDPLNAKAMAEEIARVLTATDPERAAVYAGNLAALVRELDALDNDLKGELAGVRGRPFIVFHDATQYLEARYGLAAAGSITISPEVPPSAKRLTEVRQKLKALGAICVFAEPRVQQKLLATVTEGTAARSATIDPEALLLKPGPGLYFELMRGVAHSLATCLAAG